MGTTCATVINRAVEVDHVYEPDDPRRQQNALGHEQDSRQDYRPAAVEISRGRRLEPGDARTREVGRRHWRLLGSRQDRGAHENGNEAGFPARSFCRNEDRAWATKTAARKRRGLRLPASPCRREMSVRSDAPSNDGSGAAQQINQDRAQNRACAQHGGTGNGLVHAGVDWNFEVATAVPSRPFRARGNFVVRRVASSAPSLPTRRWPCAACLHQKRSAQIVLRNGPFEPPQRGLIRTS